MWGEESPLLVCEGLDRVVHEGRRATLPPRAAHLYASSGRAVQHPLELRARSRPPAPPSRAASRSRGRRSQRGDLVVEPGAVADHAPAHAGVATPAPGQRARDQRERPRHPDPDHAPLARLQRVAVGRADRLEDVARTPVARGRRPRTGRRGARRRTGPRSTRARAALARPERSSSASRANESWNAAQCSRSTARRMPPPARSAAAPGAARHRLAPCLGVVHPPPEQPGQRRARRAGGRSPRWNARAPSPTPRSSSIERLPSSSTRPARESITTRRVSPRSRQ